MPLVAYKFARPLGAFERLLGERVRARLFLRAVDPRWIESSMDADALPHEVLLNGVGDVEMIVPHALGWSLDADRRKRIRGAPVRFSMRPQSNPELEPPLFGVLLEDDTADDVSFSAPLKLMDVPTSEYDASGIAPLSQAKGSLTNSGFRLYGFSEAQQRTHPFVDVPSEHVRAFLPSTGIAQSTSLAPCALLAHPGSTIGVRLLLDGQPSRALPEGKQLFDALFTAADTQDEGSAAAFCGFVRSRLSCAFRGEDTPVPLLIPRAQADGDGAGLTDSGGAVWTPLTN